MPQNNCDSIRKKCQKVFHSSNLLIVFSLITFVLVGSIRVNAQVEAIFNAVPEEGCNPLVVTFQNFSTGSNLSYFWDFGLGIDETSTEENPVKTFPNQGYFEVALIVTNSVTLETDTAKKLITVRESPDLDFYFDAGTYCVNEPVVFTFFPTDRRFDNLVWKFGDGTTSVNEELNPITHVYDTNGTYTVTLYSYLGACGDTASHTVLVKGPKASFTMSGDEGCIGDQITFTLGDTAGISNYNWRPEGEGGVSISNVNPYLHTYETGGLYEPFLEVYGPDGSCKLYDTTANIYRIEAEFDYKSTSEFCSERNVYFDNKSNNYDFSSWDLGNGETSTDNEPIQSYTAGDYTVTLTVSNNFGCEDDTSQSFTINNIPSILIGNDTTICLGDSARLWASGGHIIDWKTEVGISNRYSYSPNASPESTFEYTPQVRDTITNCYSIPNSVVQKVNVLVPPELIFKIQPSASDSLVYDTIVYNGAVVPTRADTIPDYNYLWSPDENISCVTCATPEIRPIYSGDYEYIVLVSDKFNCGSMEDTLTIRVEELYTIGVSEAFTPNGDNTNEYFTVDEYGVKNLIEFSVYNRWGNKVYSTNDLTDAKKIGWDGTFNGKEQSADTYTYYIKAEMQNDTFIEKRGAFRLIR